MIKNLPRPWTLGLALCAVLAAPAAQTTVNPYAPDRPEKGSVEAIAGFTTEARFGNPWVAYVPASETVPSPTRYLGHVAGAEGELTGTAKIYGYFRRLAETSPRRCTGYWFCTIVVKALMATPRPRPITAVSSQSEVRPEPMVMRLSR